MRIVLLALLLVAGCTTSIVRSSVSEFEPLGKDSYKYVASFGSSIPLDAAGDVTRREMLEAWLSENGACPKGYTIADRQIVKAGHSLFGEPWGKIVHTVNCK